MIWWIDNGDALAELLHALPAGPIALDTEFMRQDTFFPRLALVQVNVGERAALVDPLPLHGLGGLGTRMTAPEAVCVMHSASEDLEAFGTVGTGVATLFDTQIAAAMTGLGPGLSYQKLVAQLCGVELPKAETREDAEACLSLLSGRSHIVMTGVAVADPQGTIRTRLVETRVRFKHLSRDELNAYLDSNEWHGKAGGYAIQGLAGVFVLRLVGSYTNVVGLPLYETVSLLEGAGFPVRGTWRDEL